MQHLVTSFQIENGLYCLNKVNSNRQLRGYPQFIFFAQETCYSYLIVSFLSISDFNYFTADLSILMQTYNWRFYKSSYLLDQKRYVNFFFFLNVCRSYIVQRFADKETHCIRYKKYQLSKEWYMDAHEEKYKIVIQSIQSVIQNGVAISFNTIHKAPKVNLQIYFYYIKQFPNCTESN